jgi:hypothetical protein
VIIPRCSHGFQDPVHKTPSQGFKILIRVQGYIQEYDVARYGVYVTSELTQWSGSLTPKVHLYNTFLGGLHHLPPRMKNQHGLNEEKNHVGKKIVSQLSACDVTHVVSLVTNNLKRNSL